MDLFDKINDKQQLEVKKIMQVSREAHPNGVVFFGDELIHHFKIDKYFNVLNLYNCGVSDATTDLLLHLNPYAINDYKPRKVIILIGTNDLNDLHQFDKLESAFNLFKLIEIMNMKNPGLESVVISPLPIDEKRWSQRCKDNTQLKLLGNEYKANTKELSRCEYIDVYDEFLKDGQLNPNLTDDGLLLNEKGYDLLAELIKEYI